MKQDIKIYKLESEVVLAIDRMAKEHGMSRNKYLIGILKNHVIAGEIKRGRGTLCEFNQNEHGSYTA